MCGIVGAIAERDVLPILIEGLKRLEYRGYDSAGVALVNDKNDLLRVRSQGKVKELEKHCSQFLATAKLVLPIHVGQHTASQVIKMPTRMFVIKPWRLFITVLSRIMRRYEQNN